MAHLEEGSRAGRKYLLFRMLKGGRGIPLCKLAVLMSLFGVGLRVFMYA
jgi:hypothetical protein